MIWQTDSPTQLGWYFVRHRDCTSRGEEAVVRVVEVVGVRVEDGERRWETSPQGNVSRYERSLEWAGPIPEPEERH